MTSPPTTARVQWPAMDGLRALSILMVMGVHAYLWKYDFSGVVGVDVFFVLSGFLITTILIREWDSRGQISLRNFYARRALRLFPALLLAIVIAMIIIIVGRAYGFGPLTMTGLPWVVLYVGDFARAVSQPFELGLLGPTWSLAVEEQFYLVWPFAFLFLMRRKVRRGSIAIVLVGLALVEMIYRAELLRHGASVNRIQVSPDTRCDGLLLGCAVAFWLSSRAGRPFPPAVGRLLQVAAVVGFIGTGIAVHHVALGHGSRTFTRVIPIAVVSTAIIVVSIVSRPVRPLNWLLSLPPLVWLGKRSYCLYLVHYPIFVATRAVDGAWRARALGFALSIAVAALSYELWERPWLRLKVRFETGEGLSAAGADQLAQPAVRRPVEHAAGRVVDPVTAYHVDARPQRFADDQSCQA